jgi:hypothetical protein
LRQTIKKVKAARSSAYNNALRSRSLEALTITLEYQLYVSLVPFFDQEESYVSTFTLDLSLAFDDLHKSIV